MSVAVRALTNTKLYRGPTARSEALADDEASRRGSGAERRARQFLNGAMQARFDLTAREKAHKGRFEKEGSARPGWRR